MAGVVNQTNDYWKNRVSKSIQLADQIWQITKVLQIQSKDKPEFVNLKSNIEKLSVLLRQVSREYSQLYKQPAHKIIAHTEQDLRTNHSILLKHRFKYIINLVVNIVPPTLRCGAKEIWKQRFITYMRKMSQMLNNAIGDIKWLLRVSKVRIKSHVCDDAYCDDEYLGLPPIAANEPIRCLIWEQIALLYSETSEERSEGAASLCSISKDNECYAKLIMEEGGVAPLLKLIENGSMKDQENATRAIGLIGHDEESVQHIINAGACRVFENILRQGPMTVRVSVASAVSELAGNYAKCQDVFADHNVVHLLISHHSELRKMKAMAVKALWKLAKGNLAICRIILKENTHLCFAEYLENGPDDLQSYSAMALMEITAVIDKYDELRKSASRTNSKDLKSIADQLIKIIQKKDSGSQLLIPCINGMGNLARTFRQPEPMMIAPLVRLLLSQKECEVITREACVALTKFACTDNHYHLKNCKEIISIEVAECLIQLVYFEEKNVKVPALVLMCYIALHAPESEVLAMLDEMLTMLGWVSKEPFMTQYQNLDPLRCCIADKSELAEQTGVPTKVSGQDNTLGTLLNKAKFRLQFEKCRSRGLSDTVVTVTSVTAVKFCLNLKTKTHDRALLCFEEFLKKKGAG